jgi:hypothetical protein
MGTLQTRFQPTLKTLPTSAVVHWLFILSLAFGILAFAIAPTHNALRPATFDPEKEEEKE